MQQGFAAFDDPLDQNAIRLGFQIYRSGGRSISPEFLMQMVRQNRSMLSSEPLQQQIGTPQTSTPAQPKMNTAQMKMGQGV